MLINEDSLKKVLSSNIKCARSNLKLTQESLSEKLNISNSFLKDIEGGRSSASLLTFVKLCQALEVTPNDVLKNFFKNEQTNNDNLIQQISLLDDYEKKAIYALIDYFNNNNK